MKPCQVLSHWGHEVRVGSRGRSHLLLLQSRAAQGKGRLASEAGSGEGPAMEVSWGAFDVAGVLWEAGARGPPCTAGPAVSVQAATGGRKAEASVSWLEAVKGGESLAAGWAVGGSAVAWGRQADGGCGDA